DEVDLASERAEPIRHPEGDRVDARPRTATERDLEMPFSDDAPAENFDVLCQEQWSRVSGTERLQPLQLGEELERQRRERQRTIDADRGTKIVIRRRRRDRTLESIGERGDRRRAQRHAGGHTVTAVSDE